ncbi:MAG: DUF3108 domain-containing protein [Desulfuromonadales bacterium]|nr:DUF3108 domain-containing protein [Desulfuromonadales bacterium]
MHESRRTIILFTLSLLASILTHVLFIYALGWFGRYDLTGPIMLSQAVMVDLTASTESKHESLTEPQEPQDHTTKASEQNEPEPAENGRRESNNEASSQPPLPAQQPSQQPEPQPVPSPLPTPQEHVSGVAAQSHSEIHKKSPTSTVIEITPPLRTAMEFMSAEQEVLSYRITLLGFPVGSGILEAKQEKSAVKITLRVTSSLVIASIYPVDDLIETRLLGGNYIITKIRQLEGKFVGDRGFTLFLREKSVFWIDLLKQTSVQEALPTSDVLDILSGLYYLRNRPLQVGTTETLHIFDSNIYTSVPVEVVRREKIFLPGFRRADTLLLHPLIKTEGIFKRAGDVFIWVTNDENHVPVRVETTIKLGKVTAELIDAEVKQKEIDKQRE